MNLLVEPVFTVERPDGREAHLSLPGVLERLGHDDPIEFSALRPMQQHGWYAFLVQIAAAVLDRAGDLDIERSEAAWREGLLALVGGDESAWSLVVEDLERPGFMQCPIGPKLQKELAKKRKAKDVLLTPDASALDVLVTSRAFDVQPGRIVNARVEHWVYALVTLQTMQGYSGKFNYGVARMPGATATRACISRTPSTRFAPRFRRDVGVWLSRLASITQQYGYDPKGTVALWTVFWDGGSDERLPFSSLHPCFVEVAKPVRLYRSAEGHISAYYAPTKASRVATSSGSGERRGTGDIWSWTREEKGERITYTPWGTGGWGYRDVSAILFSREGGAAALAEGAFDGPAATLFLHALVRAKGKTLGLREREVPLPSTIVSGLADDAKRATMGEEAIEHVKIADLAGGAVLKFAIRALLGAGDPKKADAKDKRLGAWVERYNASVDRDFFPGLWESLEAPSREAGRAAWARRCIEIAREVFEEACRGVTVPIARSIEAVAKSQNAFEGSARKHLGVAFQKETPAS